MSEPTSTADLVVQAYVAFTDRDRAAMEALLAPDFTFTSPYDDHIDRAAYFERCWPNGELFKSFSIRHVFGQGDEAFVLYEVETKAGDTFRNTEFFTRRDGRLASVEVFFGQK